MLEHFLDALDEIIAHECIDHVVDGFGHDAASEIGVGLLLQSHHGDLSDPKPAERKIDTHPAPVRQIEWIRELRDGTPGCRQRCLLETTHASREEDLRDALRYLAKGRKVIGS